MKHNSHRKYLFEASDVRSNLNDASEEEKELYNLVLSKLGSGHNALHQADVETAEGVTYISHLSNAIKDQDLTEIKITQVIPAIQYIKYAVLNMYMRKVNEYKMPDDKYFIPSTKWDYDGDLDIIKENMRNIVSGGGIDGNNIWKVISPNHVMYFECKRDLPIEEMNHSIVLLMIHFDKLANVCKISHIVLTDDDLMHANDLAIGPFYIAKKDYTIKKYIDKTNARTSGQIDATAIKLIRLATTSFLAEHISDLDDYPIPKYCTLELQTFGQIMRNSWFLDWRMISLHNWMNKDGRIGTDYFNNLDREDRVPECFGLSYQVNYPRVKFSKKEWKFVDDYCSKQGFKYGDTSAEPFNIRNILVEPKYGESLTFTYTDQEGHEYDITASYTYNPTRDLCRFYLVHYVNANYSVAVIANLWDMQHLQLSVSNNISEIDLKMLVHENGILPVDFNQVMDEVPFEFFITSGITRMLYAALKIFMIIHDRPKRSRMVREERKITVNNQRNGSNKKSNKKPESDVVITRILMPIQEAKEYVNTMRETAGEHPERNYVLESWPRAGHYRRRPHSDETIWIEETTCKRHMPLTDKEVVIKL